MQSTSIELVGISARRVEPGLHDFEARLTVSGKPVTIAVKPADLTNYETFQQTALTATGLLFVHPDVSEALPGRCDRIWQRVAQTMLRDSAAPLQK